PRPGREQPGGAQRGGLTGEGGKLPGRRLLLRRRRPCLCRQGPRLPSSAGDGCLQGACPPPPAPLCAWPMSAGAPARVSDAKTCPAHAGAAAERGVDLALARRRARPLAIRRGRGLRARRRGWRGLKRVSRGWVRRRRGQEEGEGGRRRRRRRRRLFGTIA
ncbi:unnamed protein product, partial [Prorocentrum cordatum]